MFNIYDTFFEPEEVVEIRAIGGLHGRNKAWEGSCFGAKGVVSGYFDNAEDFAKAAKALDNAGASGIYFTPNPCKPALFARAANRLKANINTTADDDILCLRWLLVDLDPVRPSGVSSSEEELSLSLELAKKIAGWLEKEKKWPKGIRALSGNGYHIMYRLKDLENSAENVVTIRRALMAIANKFRDFKTVEVDEKVFNPARIWKLYGTMARKGDSIPERPHRRSDLYLSK